MIMPLLVLLYWLCNCHGSEKLGLVWMQNILTTESKACLSLEAMGRVCWAGSLGNQRQANFFSGDFTCDVESFKGRVAESRADTHMDPQTLFLAMNGEMGFSVDLMKLYIIWLREVASGCCMCTCQETLPPSAMREEAAL
eukprot:c25532_g1_i1 orf=282-701(-)